MKKIVLTTIAALSVMCASAAPVTVSQAQSVAQQFVSANASMRAPARGGTSLTLAHEAKAASGLADFYVFNRGAEGGYVMVAGDDAALPVLGYSDSGTFDYDQLPCNAKWWLEQYQKEIQWLRNHPGTTPRKAQQLTTSVSPLLKTKWNQDAPFNNQCPTYSSWWGSQHCATGCVATATAQIMKYHEWPVTGKGSHSYTCEISGGYWGSSSTETLSADFSQSTYQWSQMLNNYNGSYTNAQANAVAKLMSDVGIAEEMGYGPESGTSSYMAYYALKTYFDYDATLRYVMRDFYELDEWEQMLRDELDAHRPVYYAGTGTAGGHAFVFDGYNTNGYFHVNWGWGGDSDDYFASTALNPSSIGIGGGEGGFNSGQDAIIGIKPNEGGVATDDPLRGLMSTFSTTATQAQLGSKVNFTMEGIIFVGVGSWNSLMWGIALTDNTGTNVLNSSWVVDASDISIGGTYNMTEAVGYTIPNGLTNGEYRIYSAYKLNNTISFFERPTSSPYVLMTVVDGVAYFTGDVPESRARLTLVTDITPAEDLMPADDIRATAVVQAEEADWSGELTACVMDKQSDDTYTTVANITANITARLGSTSNVSFFGAFDGIDGHTYYLTILDPATGEVWGDYHPFVVGTPVSALITPADGDVVNFGEVAKGSTNIQQLSVQGENITGSLTLTLGGQDATYFKLSSSSLSATAVMRGTKVNITYRPTVVAQHQATLTITGGGLAQPVTVRLMGMVEGSAVKGDINLDGKVDVDDVNILINIILEHEPADGYGQRPYIDGDDKIDVADVNALLNIILQS